MTFAVYVLAAGLVGAIAHLVVGWGWGWTLPIGFFVASPLLAVFERLSVIRHRRYCTELCHSGEDATRILAAFRKLLYHGATDTGSVTAVGLVAITGPLLVVYIRMWVGQGPNQIIRWGLWVVAGVGFVSWLVSSSLAWKLHNKDVEANAAVGKLWRACSRDTCQTAVKMLREEQDAKETWFRQFSGISMKWPSLTCNVQVWPAKCCSCARPLSGADREVVTVSDLKRHATGSIVFKLELPICSKRSCQTDPANNWARPEPALRVEDGLGHNWIVRNLHRDFIDAAVALRPVEIETYWR